MTLVEARPTALSEIDFAQFPRVPLCHQPTPIEPMLRLTEHLGGPRLFIKRDDCTGLATGDNKTRKLEFLVGEALKANADMLVTQGAAQSSHVRQPALQPAPRLGGATLPKAFHGPVVVAALIAALAIVNAPKRPVDVSAPVRAARLPMQLLGERAQPIALSETEQQYFTAYGGTAQKVQYGPMGLNIVRTTSPLRHLHSPETCLLGMGYSAKFLGTRYDPRPSSIYEATGPDGQVWAVAVSYISDDGQQTPSVGEAVWSWLNGASRSWQSVQRITPKSLSETDRISFEHAALAALDL